MEPRYLLDTNTIIDFAAGLLPSGVNRKLSDIIDDLPTMSFINKIELLAFDSVPQSINSFVKVANVIGIDDDIILQAINIRRVYRLKFRDAIIAATALVNNLILITHNIKDFGKIDGLAITDSHLL